MSTITITTWEFEVYEDIYETVGTCELRIAFRSDALLKHAIDTGIRNYDQDLLDIMTELCHEEFGDDAYHSRGLKFVDIAEEGECGLYFDYEGNYMMTMPEDEIQSECSDDWCSDQSYDSDY